MQKTGNFNDKILRKSQKTLFLGQKCPILAQNRPKIFFRKIGLRHFLSSMVLRLHAKNENISMSQSREKLITDERKNGRTEGHGLIYRTFTSAR